MIIFDQLANSVGKKGRHVNEIFIKPENGKELEKRLTFINKAAQYEIKRLNSTPYYGPQYEEKRLQQIEALKDELVQELFNDEGDGWYSVPAGFWYLCETKEDDFHVSEAIPPKFLEGTRDYQKESVSQLLTYNRAMCVLATGLGKSFVIANVCNSALAVGKRILIVVPTIDLVDQMVKGLRKVKDNVCGIGGKYKFKPGVDIAVTTANSALGYSDMFDVLLCDEAHHLAADTWMQICLNAEKAKNVYLLTATPYRTDGKDVLIHAFGGPVVYEKDTKWAIEHGWLTRPKIIQVACECKLKNPPSERVNNMKAYHALITQRHVFDFMCSQIKKMLASGRMVMVLFTTVKAGESFKKFCALNGLDFDVAHAKFRKPFNDFKENKTQLLVGNAKLFGEGVDIPNASAIINCCNNSSEGQTRQIIGRALRLAPGKKDAIVMDISVMGYGQFERAHYNRKRVFKTIEDNIKEVSI